MKACATCTNWQLKASPLARNGLAPCALGKRYTSLPPDHACERHKPIDQAAADARVPWLGRIGQKHSKGMVK